MQVDTDFIFKDNFRQFNVCFVFAQKKCSYAAFGEQNKIDNDCKYQQVYKTKKNRCFTCVCELFLLILRKI